MMLGVKLFPSPIYGVSFKLAYMLYRFDYMRENSFRPLYTGLVSNYEKLIQGRLWHYVCFRPLYTGLVSNPVPWNPRRYWAENAVCG